MDLFEARRQSHEMRSKIGTAFVINADGAAFEEYKPPTLADLGIGDTREDLQRLGEFAKGAGRVALGGVQDAVEGVVSTAGDIAGAIEDRLGIETDKPNIGDSFTQGLKNLGIEVPEGDSTIEQLGRGLVQFAAGMGVAPVRGAGILANTGRGAFADALFDPEEGNLSTLINEAGLGNVVTEFLDSKVGEDAEAEERLTGRLKAALEGAGLGIPIDVAVNAFQAVKNLDPNIVTKIKDRINQPGEMPTVGAMGGNVGDEIEKARLAYELNPNNNKLRKLYFDLRRARDAIKSVDLPTKDKPGIIAFHGSGADFNEFKIEEIGTGEGNQAFGYGLYFTESEDIAKFYRKAVGAGNEVTYKGKKVQDLDEDGASYEENLAHMVGQQDSFFDKRRVIENEIARTRKSLSGIKQSIKDFQTNPKVYPLKYSGMTIEMNDAIGIKEFLETQLADAIEVEKNLSTIKTKPGGRIYKVGITPTSEELLDYDKPLGDQTNKIQSKLKKLINNELNEDDAANLGFEAFEISKARKNMLDKNRSVVSFLNDWAVFRGEESSGEKLLEKYDIPGIKYKANQGVGARNAPEAGVQNFVIFDDALISILKKYGIVGPVAISAAGLEKSTTTDGQDS